MRSKVLTFFVALVMVGAMGSSVWARQISFGYVDVDSNTLTYITRLDKDYSTDYVYVDLDRILTPSGSWDNYTRIKARIYVATTAEALSPLLTLYGSTVANKLVSNRITLSRRVSAGTNISFFAMGNDPSFDCRIRGIFTAN